MKVLIVEDEQSIYEMYRFKFENERCLVRVATNGADGLELAKEFAPDVILLDLRMPVMTGDEMLSRLRSEEWGADIRVIILTNISKNEAPHALRFLNVDRYVVKAHTTPGQIVKIAEEVMGIK